jgi:hypothetical protein
MVVVPEVASSPAFRPSHEYRRFVAFVPKGTVAVRVSTVPGE